jgi:hypothetical protein
MEPAGETLYPEVGDEFTEQAVELKSAWNHVMLTRSELAADPLHGGKTIIGPITSVQPRALVEAQDTTAKPLC